MTLELDRVTVAAGGTTILRELSLRVEAGTRTALVGPSGAGKTTLLRAVAGLAEVAGGDVRFDGRSLAGVPAHRRAVAVVFQEPRLLPHLDVAENVALPLRARKVRRGERASRARALLDEVGLGALAGRAVTDLSGGEQQRVALARALCAEPALLLLDEPLAALDPGLREELRRLLIDVHAARGITLLLVTHDRQEAAELGQRVALLLDGRIVQEGPPPELFERPVTREVARFFGTANVLEGEVVDGHMAVPGTDRRVAVPGPDGPAVFVIRPEHVGLQAGGPLQARVREAVYTGTAVRLQLELGDLRLTAVAVPGRAPAAGDLAHMTLPVEHLWRLPGDGATGQ